MSGSSGEEKTEKPTAKKRKESRKEGQVPRTQELGGWAAVLAVELSLPLLLVHELKALHRLMSSALRGAQEATPAQALALLGEGAWHAMLTLVVLGCCVMVIGVAGALSQGGFYLATKSVQPKWSKINPIQGAKRVLGTQALWEGVKMIIKSGVVAVLGYLAVRAMMPVIGGLMPIPVVLDIVADEALALMRNIAIAGVVMAGADYAFQRRKVGKQVRMTKHEVKQEHKQTDGDPLVKAAIRGKQMAMSRSRMMSDVPEADVVLVNPTHVAVALRYDTQRGAPRVVARGAGAIATRIREVAAEAEVPTVQDVPLARSLYQSCEVGQEIPLELFAAVAEVLAFVISRRSAGTRGGRHRSPRRESDLPDVPTRGRRRRSTPRAASGPTLGTCA